MTRYRLNLLMLGAALLVIASLSFARTEKKAISAQAFASVQDSHVMVTPAQVKWGPAPPALPAGAQVAVLAGDPSQAGAPFTIRAKFPNGYTVPPHWHPSDENVVVIKGALLMGLGDKLNTASAKLMPAGSYMMMPQGVRHFARARGETIVQIYAIGPFDITYVNPADDPRNKSGK